MARISRDDLLKALAREQERVQALSLLVRDLTPRAGWYFVESERAHQSFLLFVDESGFVVAYNNAIGSKERSARDAELYRSCQDSSHYLESYFDAQKAAQDHRARLAKKASQ